MLSIMYTLYKCGKRARKWKNSILRPMLNPFSSGEKRPGVGGRARVSVYLNCKVKCVGGCPGKEYK